MGKLFCCLWTGLLLTGCAAPPSPAAKAPEPLRNSYSDIAEKYVPYQPASAPAVPPPAAVAELPPDLPEAPSDAARPKSLLYTVELWEILLPRDSVSSDEVFWKRVNEQAIDLSVYDVMFKNGFRVGELPVNELNNLLTLIDERKGKRTKLQGTAGKQIEIPIQANIDRQTLFYFNRSNQLIGRSYDKCENVMYLSFETTPRNPDQIRMSLTPAVRGQNRKLQYATVPGREDREIRYASTESHYETNLRLDLPLKSVLVVAPSIEARFPSSLGAAFMVQNTPSEQLERLIVVVPRAFQKDEAAEAR